VRTAFQHLQQMSPQDRERVMNSERFRQTFSPQEQNLIRGMVEVQGEGNPVPQQNSQPK
jgi:hypothetical protein